MRTLSHPLAFLIVILGAAAAVMLVRTVLDWSRWLVGAGGAVGMAGLVLAAGATVNLGISRTCATKHAGGDVVKETNRPAIALVLGSDDCYADALGQFEILGVIVVGESAVVVRRSTRGGRRPLPVAPTE